MTPPRKPGRKPAPGGKRLPKAKGNGRKPGTTRKAQPQFCSRCGEAGHNRRGCPLATGRPR